MQTPLLPPTQDSTHQRGPDRLTVGPYQTTENHAPTSFSTYRKWEGARKEGAAIGNVKSKLLKRKQKYSHNVVNRTLFSDTTLFLSLLGTCFVSMFNETPGIDKSRIIDDILDYSEAHYV